MKKGESHWTKLFVNNLCRLPIEDSTAKQSLELLLKGLENCRLQVLEATRAMRQLCEREDVKTQIELLRSVPGVGFITSLLILTEIGDINRFINLDRLCMYVGLVPTMRQSGDGGYIGELTVRGHPVLRTALVEAAWRGIKVDPALAKAFIEYSKRMRKNKAIIKICRKLLNRIRYVLKNQVKYEKYIVNGDSSKNVNN